MTQFLFAIKDTKVGFDQPFIQHSEAVALRTVQGMVNSNERNALKDYVEDKELYAIGMYDTDTGIITSDVHLVARLVNLVKVSEV